MISADRAGCAGGSETFWPLWPLAQAATSCFGSEEWPADLPVPQAWIEFEVRDIQVATDVLIAKGYRLLIANREEPWGQTVSRLLSPEGLLTGRHHYTMAPRGGSVKAPLLTTDRLRLVPTGQRRCAADSGGVSRNGKSCVIWRPVFRGRSRMTGVSLCEHDCFTGCRKG
ncbi:Uncharacterised protein [Raoultella planticola]|uniref:Uncharacterized protein n=1 Tax=Raoultella planticola TaxID=575 RepID=A0A485A6M6_RAOPL|nr:Uncharacterised protein [Raoultella planticola]